MGLFGASAQRNFIITQKIELQAEEIRLRDYTRKLTDQRSESLMAPPQAPDPYKKDSNGSYVMNNGSLVAMPQEEYNRLYQEYLTNYTQQDIKNKLIDEKLNKEEDRINISLANIAVQLQSLEAEKEGLNKTIEAANKRVFGVG